MRTVQLLWACSCGAGSSLTFDLGAPKHSRTHQCKFCGLAVDVPQPRMRVIVPPLAVMRRPAPPSNDPATGESPKGDPR